MKRDQLGPMRYAIPSVSCEWQCGSAALDGKDLCGPCFADFCAAEAEGVELCREDFEVDSVLRHFHSGQR